MTTMKHTGQPSTPRAILLTVTSPRRRACALALALSVALGGHAAAQAADASAVLDPPHTNVDESTTIALSEGLNPGPTNAIAIGGRALAIGDMSVAIGQYATTTADHAVALGGLAHASAKGSMALGAFSMAYAADSVAIGYGSMAGRANTVSVGKTGAERQITHVAAGTMDTDAVNMAQLRAAGLFDQQGNTLDAVTYDAGSQRGLLTFAGQAGTRLSNVMEGVIAPGSRDAVNGGQLWVVQDQIDKIGDRVTNLERPQPITSGPLPIEEGKQGTPGNTTDNSEKPTSDNGGATTDGVDGIDYPNPASEGSPGNHAPPVSASTPATDAARWDQMRDAVSDVKTWANDKFDGMSRQIKDNQRQANRGIAASAALIDNMPYLPGKTTLNTGFATYRGQTAFGLGVSRWSENGRVNVNAGISAAAGDRPIFRVGLGLVLGD
jgi:autotransporter adhesin